MSRATSTMYAGIQLIMPGETAPAHRHTPSALRFMLEGEGAFTAVGGERTTMRARRLRHHPVMGLPRPWQRGQRSLRLARRARPAVSSRSSRRASTSTTMTSASRSPAPRATRWRLVRLEHAAAETRKPLRADHADLQLSLRADPRRRWSPRRRASDPDAHEAVSLRYANPIDGGWAMPTMSAWMMHRAEGLRDDADALDRRHRHGARRRRADGQVGDSELRSRGARRGGRAGLDVAQLQGGRGLLPVLLLRPGGAGKARLCEARRAPPLAYADRYRHNVP